MSHGEKYLLGMLAKLVLYFFEKKRNLLIAWREGREEREQKKSTLGRPLVRKKYML